MFGTTRTSGFVVSRRILYFFNTAAISVAHCCAIACSFLFLFKRAISSGLGRICSSFFIVIFFFVGISLIFKKRFYLEKSGWRTTICHCNRCFDILPSKFHWKSKNVCTICISSLVCNTYNAFSDCI